MKYAWIENGSIRDIAPGDPAEYYTPEVASFYTTLVDDEAKKGAVLIDGQWINPVIPSIPAESIPERPKLLSEFDIRSQMSLNERVRWDNDKSDEIVTAKLELANFQTAEMITPVLQMLVDSGDISQETMNKVLQ